MHDRRNWTFLSSGNCNIVTPVIIMLAVLAIISESESIGLCTVQYLYGTEIYPTRIRGVCYAINMALHWFFQFAVVRVTPNMFVSLDIYGAYIF